MQYTIFSNIKYKFPDFIYVVTSWNQAAEFTQSLYNTHPKNLSTYFNFGVLGNAPQMFTHNMPYSHTLIEPKNYIPSKISYHT